MVKKGRKIMKTCIW